MAKRHILFDGENAVKLGINDMSACNNKDKNYA